MSQSIIPIANDDVHRITSGQVIIDLCSAIKELIENSLDANSSRIEVVFKNYGVDSIEVNDDGDGIEPKDFPNICLKHYTSKLSSFEDLLDVKTLGFRGEAMSSLCAIANVKLTTATKKDAPRATSLEFSSIGEMVKKTVVVGKKGTTISISNLFESLPVRRKDFIKNSRREFQKTLAFIQNYAIIAPKTRFTIYNITVKGNKSLILGTQGNSLLKDSIISVFGSNGMHGLIPLDLELDLESESYVRRSDLGNLRIAGYISNCSFGLGRSTTDRQIFFLNNRPVTLRPFSKVINEVYKTFNHVQYPVIILNLLLDSHSIDINVTPDKRTILIHNESIILDFFRERLIEFYNDQSNVVPRNTSTSAIKDEPTRKISVKTERLLSKYKNREKTRASDEIVQEPEESEIEDPMEVEDEYQKTAEVEADEDEDEDVSEEEIEIEEEGEGNELNTSGSVLEDIQVSTRQRDSTSMYPEDMQEMSSYEHGSKTRSSPPISPKRSIEEVDTEPSVSLSSDTPLPLSESRDYLHISIGDTIINEKQNKRYKTRLVFEENDDDIGHNHDHNQHCSHDQNDMKRQASHNESLFVEEKDDDEEESLTGDTTPTIIESTPKKVSVPEEELKINSRSKLSSNYVHKLLGYSNWGLPKSSYSSGRIHSNDLINEGGLLPLSKKKIDDINATEEAEAKLSLSVSKQDFMDMKIIGQFNLGFILVTRPKPDNKALDLFIIDQHASDEKFNFEKLQRETVFQSQPLVIPTPIELSVIDEIAVMDNRETFERNGFKLTIDEETFMGKRIQLSSLPLSKSTVFDMSDFNELLHLVKENSGSSSVRCSKIRAMFAMRACRSSIMIGKPLSRKTMTTVVRHLSELDKPWNCPHGRPTMRHLMELNGWSTFKDDYIL